MTPSESKLVEREELSPWVSEKVWIAEMAQFAEKGL